MRISDWSSDVCSSDLGLHKLIVAHERGARHPKHGKDIAQALALIDWHQERAPHELPDAGEDLAVRGEGWVKRGRGSLGQAPAAPQARVERRSEERRVGKEGDSTERARWWPCQ